MSRPGPTADRPTRYCRGTPNRAAAASLTLRMWPAVDSSARPSGTLSIIASSASTSATGPTVGTMESVGYPASSLMASAATPRRLRSGEHATSASTRPCWALRQNPVGPVARDEHGHALRKGKAKRDAHPPLSYKYSKMKDSEGYDWHSAGPWRW